MILDTLRHDLKYAIRGLRAKPGFTIAVVSTLALGIGANAAMFGIVDRLLFRPPARMIDPETAHRVYPYQTFRGEERVCCDGQYARYLDLVRFTSSFSAVTGYTRRDLAVGSGEASREMSIGIVSANFFGYFDAPPALGRYFGEAEDQPPEGSPVVVLSYPMWQTRYGGRADVIDTTLQIGPVVYTVIGVAPPGFVGMWADRPPAAFIPITSYAAGSRFGGDVNWWETYSWGWMSTMVRRKPDVSIAAANADLTQAFYRSYQAQVIEQPRVQPIEIAKPRGIAGSILAERGPRASDTGKVATWVGGVSVIVLLIACANVANLHLARALRRRREIALRIALGVSRGRLLRQLLTESTLLAVLGGAVGLLIAHWGGAALRSTLLDRSEAAGGLQDVRTVLFAGGAALLVGLLTGLAPVLQARRADLTSDLKTGVREGGGHRGAGTRRALLILQSALSVILLVGAGLFVRSLQNVEEMRLGYDVDPVLLANLNMRGVTLDSAESVALRYRLLETARATPGVENASLQVAVPFWSTWSVSLYVDGIDTVGKLGQFNLNAVSPEFFQTLGTRIIRGRGIGPDDSENSPRAIVVSEAMGRVLWPGKDPIGQCIRVRSDTLPCTYVIGIAENIKAQSLAADSGFYYYLPATQFNIQGAGLFLRVRGDPSRQAESIRAVLQRDMPGASYITMRPFEEIVGSQKRSWRLGATMFVAFGGMALLLAAIGLYSVIAYDVVQRTHELGVRRALGAQVLDAVRLVVSDGLRIALIGIVAGLVVALWASKFVEPLLFDVSAKDPTVFILVSGILLLVALAASSVPALRASRVDPNVALRTE
jgi:predicted permease